MSDEQTSQIEHEAISEQAPTEPQPRWPAALAIITVPLLYVALPQHLRYIPEWVPLGITAALLIPLLLSHKMAQHDWVQYLGYAISGFHTLVLVSALSLMVCNITRTGQTAMDYLRAAGVLFPTNVLVFALWYWRLDAGGPRQRDIAGAHVRGEFLFPQMTMDPEIRKQTGMEHWVPGFVDYLFLAYNTSTALSPADTGALTRLAKVLMILQSTISLTIIVLLAARAVNMMG